MTVRHIKVMLESLCPKISFGSLAYFLYLSQILIILITIKNKYKNTNMLESEKIVYVHAKCLCNAESQSDKHSINAQKHC